MFDFNAIRHFVVFKMLHKPGNILLHDCPCFAHKREALFCSIPWVLGVG